VLPVATQDAVDRHETSLSWAVVVPLGTGVALIAQVEPFHRSASG
jgi:hypothetical protein